MAKVIQTEIQLVLTPVEAATLFRLVGNITGSGKCREVCNDIYYALEQAGVDSSSVAKITTGNIRFSDAYDD